MFQRSIPALKTLSAPAITVLALVAHSAAGAAPPASAPSTAPPAPAARAESAAPPAAAQVERGAYLVKIMGCNDCHTPFKMGPKGPEPDMTRMLSGHPQDLVMPAPPPLTAGAWDSASSASITAWAGPWGISYTRNLTPDKETGLGNWTEQEFIQTLRTGRERGIGREILPPMPWPGYGKATDEDLAAIFAYLRSIPAVSNRVPDNVPPAAPPGAPAAKP